MLINSVILILQETLEAALLIGVLLAINAQLRCHHRWLWYGLSTGAIIAALFALNMGSVAEWFDYAGQEVMNTVMQSLICLFLAAAVWLVSGLNRFQLGAWQQYGHYFGRLCGLIIMLAVIREGQEIMLYLGGFFSSGKHLQQVTMGSIIGFGIGASSGILLFYGLVGLPATWTKPVSLTLLALFAGTMLSQSALQLTQVDWIEQTAPLWDSSALLAEDSLLGELLYALVGYESKPTAAQVVSYIAGVCLVLIAAFRGSRYKRQHHLKQHHLKQQSGETA